MYQLTLTGTKTLLMKNIQMGDPDNKWVREIAKLNALKSKITEDQRAERSYYQWAGSLYFNDEFGPVLPGANVFRSIQQAAALTRQGKDVERALVMHTYEAPLEYSGPRDMESMWAGGFGPHVDRRMGVINRAPVVVVRPAFPTWSATFEFDLDEDILSINDFEYLAEKAGRLIHVGDYRRFFGSYSIEVTK